MNLNKFSEMAHWLPRLSLAAIFLYHGFAKFPAAQGMADMMGMPLMVVYLLALMEVVGGLFVLWGGFGPDWATRISGAIFAFIMLGAIFMVHLANGWNSMNGGVEFQVLILTVALFFVIRGNAVNRSTEA